MPFKSYAAAGFETELLPILPPDAPISPRSPQRDNLVVSRGKVPGRRSPDGWFGFGEWSVHQTTPEDCRKWSAWRAGCGLQGRRYPGVDIDVDVGGLADAIEAEALFTLGMAPCRYGRGPRRLLVYSGAGLKKRRLAFRLVRGSAEPAAGRGLHPPGVQDRGPDDLVVEGGGEILPVMAVEILGDGQQYVVEGTHPKTGKPYNWRDGSSPAQWGAEGITEVTAEEVDRFLDNVRWLIEELWDGEIVGSSGAGATGGDRAGVWQEGLAAPSLEAVAAALDAIDNDADYDAWIKIMAAVKAATAGFDEGLGFDLFADWSARSGKDTAEVTHDKWQSIRAPFAVGWDALARLAVQRSASFSAAEHEFDAAPPGEGSGGGHGAAGPIGPDSVDNMFARYAWVESAKRAVDLRTGELLDQEQFEFRIPPLVIESPAEKEGAKPRKASMSSWKAFKDSPRRRKSYKNLTCRFGEGVEFTEDLPDIEGLCLNTWRPPQRKAPIPDHVTEDDIRPYLDLAAHVIPVAAEREHVFDFMAFTAQHPGEKINHALVLGSREEGMGKDTLFEPLKEAIGRKYVRDIKQPQLIAPFNKWLVSCKLLIVQEMHNFERRATMNLLKPLVAAPPASLAINLKGIQEFYVPNLLSAVFFTNEADALSIQNGDRRYFITFNDGQPLAEAEYSRIWDWLRAGGALMVVRWLLSRDLAKFNAKGRAPGSAAKETMRRESRNPLHAWIEDGIADSDGPFERDLFLVEEVLRQAPDYTRYRGQPTGPNKLASVLKGTAARPVSTKIRIPGIDGARVIWAARRVDTYTGLSDDVLRGLFVKQRDEAALAALKENFR